MHFIKNTTPKCKQEAKIPGGNDTNFLFILKHAICPKICSSQEHLVRLSAIGTALDAGSHGAKPLPYGGLTVGGETDSQPLTSAQVSTALPEEALEGRLLEAPLAEGHIPADHKRGALTPNPAALPGSSVCVFYRAICLP